jgi:DNA N-6-adenine-methyltransferase (Dam)
VAPRELRHRGEDRTTLHAVASKRESLDADPQRVADLSLRETAKAIAGTSTLQVLGSSASPEWYTPPEIAQLANAVLGTIDLDPSWHPDSPVRAATTYTEIDDGLSKDWAGRVYLNPPYGRGIDDWISKLVVSYEDGAVFEAIALVPARVDTEWFRRLDDYPRCFVSGRLTFSNADSPAPFPSAVFYLGSHIEKFHRLFGAVGGIFIKLDGGGR